MYAYKIKQIRQSIRLKMSVDNEHASSYKSMEFTKILFCRKDIL